MAKLETYTFGGNYWNREYADMSKMFFDSLNCPLLNVTKISGDDFTIQFDGSIILKFYGYGSPGSKLTIIDHETESLMVNDFHGGYGSTTYTTIYTDSMFFLRNKNANYANTEFSFMFEKIENQKIYGICTGASTNIQDMIFEDYISRTKYQKTTALLNYPVESGTIDYLDNDAFFTYRYAGNRDPIKKILIDPHLKHVTTLTPRQTISFGGKNYYVLGPNSIVEIEE